MALEDYRADGMRCNRCSYCKWIPFDRVKSWEFAKGCPSVDYRHFHAYSAGGRLISMLSLMDGRSEISEEMIDIAYECTLCGQCDVSCKVCRYDMHILSAAREFRHYLNEKGFVPEAYPGIIGRLRESRNMGGAPQSKRADWTEGLGIKKLGASDSDETEILFHAGCQFSFDPNLRGAVQAAARLLTKGGIDFAIDEDEGCCGAKAYDMGYRDDLSSVADANLKKWAEAGIKTVVTPCATCFWAFKRLYPKVGSEVEVLHAVQVVDALLKEGKLQLTTPVSMKVTYHDPCHLGRQGEDHVPWDGKEVKIYGQAVVYDPPRPRYNGAFGVYAASPRRAQGHPGHRVGRDGAYQGSGLVLRRGRRGAAGLPGLRCLHGRQTAGRSDENRSGRNRNGLPRVREDARQRDCVGWRDHESHRRARAGRAGTLEEGRRKHGSL